VASLPLYRPTIEAGWIDFNGHVRDAYYTLMGSYAVDEVMDHLALDAEYRKRTGGTLYTLEFHIHYLREIKQSDAVQIESAVLGFDSKRIHLACRFDCPRLNGEAAATAEFMLLHVVQGESVRAASLPEASRAVLEALDAPAADRFLPGSRALALKRG
jgi:acyl-CoA thioester hydrolase